MAAAGSSVPSLLARGALDIAVISVACGTFVLVGGGGRLDVAGTRISVRSPWPLLALAGVALALALVLRGRAVTADLARLVGRLSRRAGAWVIALCIATLLAGAALGSSVAGGADSSGYVGQAQRWRQGQLRVSLPQITSAPWPHAAHTFSPLGYRPGRAPGEIVPTYPPGFPLQIAAATLLAGPRATGLVVPLLGALGVWLAFVLGRRLGGETAGLAAAMLLASSPIWLYQLMQPMSDVPVTSWWLLACGLLAGKGRGRLVLAGAACGIAVLTRPNLAPMLLLALPLAWAFRHTTAEPVSLRGLAARGAWLAAGLVPGLALLAWVNTTLYGAPWTSGYGAARQLFSAGNVAPNAVTYSRWLVDTHAPLLLLAAAGLLATLAGASRGLRAALPVIALVATAAIVVACYLPYAAFESWTYLRFLLPAIAVLAVIGGIGVARLAEALPPAARVPALALLLPAVAGLGVATARAHGAFGLRSDEARYARSAAWVASSTSAHVHVLAAQHSGSVFQTAGRAVIRWDLLDPGCAPAGSHEAEPRRGQAGDLHATAPAPDSAPTPSPSACAGQDSWLDVAWTGRWAAATPPAILVLDAEEEPAFRARFASVSELGRLDWPPAAQTDPPRPVRVYRLEDRRRYLAGHAVIPERIGEVRGR